MEYKKKLELFKKLTEKCSGIELKGKTIPYTSANGHMFSQLNKDGDLGMRFPEKVQEKYLKKLNTTHFKSYGKELREYVKMPDELWGNINQLAKYLKESHKYVQSLDPK